MTVRDYYYQHFDELTPSNQFHFATRIKNFFGSHDFDDYLETHVPNTDLAKILNDNDFSNINFLELRRPYFEKFPDLFGIEATLFRVNHLLNEYGIDTRADFLKLCSKEKLYRLSDDLLNDTNALAILSTWAVNVICLTELLFPRQKDVFAQLKDKVPDFKKRYPTLLVYYSTHIIICDSNFYTRSLTEPDLARQLLDNVASIITDHYDKLSIDAKLEFLVCSNLAHTNYDSLKKRITVECKSILATSPYLVDYRRPIACQTLDRSEHRNALFIMSGLD